MEPLDVVRLMPLMSRTGGRADVMIALIDGPVEIHHPDLAHLRLVALPGSAATSCQSAASAACRHGTFVAGILAGRRGSAAPAIAPDCTLMLRPIFEERHDEPDAAPRARPDALARALHDCVAAGARVINVSAALVSATGSAVRDVVAALDRAAREGVLVVAAAGNQGTVGGSALTSHPGVIPVIGCNAAGKPLGEATLGASIGTNGLAAPGDRITSLAAGGGTVTMAGSSAAAPFVAGALALLWSEFPRASARALRAAVTRLGRMPRRSVVPPLLDAWGSYQALRG